MTTPIYSPTFRSAGDDSSSRRAPKLVLTDQSKNLLAVLRDDPPGYALDDPYRQSLQYTGIIYLCIKAIDRAIRSATVQLMRERDSDGDGVDDGEQGGNADRLSPMERRYLLHKAMPTTHAQESDEEWVPVKDHPLCKLLARPNPRDSWSKFQSRVVIQYHLTGRCLIWGVPNAAGKPAELWVLPTAMCTPGYRSLEYPKGSWRVSQQNPYGAMGYAGGPGGSVSGTVIDARQVYDFREPHALHDWAPYSHLAGTKEQVDLVQKIDRGCWSAMDQSFDPDGVLTVPGASEEQLIAIQAQLRNTRQGPEHRGGIIAVGGPLGDTKAASFQPWTGSPKDMEYGEGWQRYVEFILAVFGLHKATVGLGNASSFSELFAAIKQTALTCYGPFVHDFAQVLSHGPVADWGVDYRVQIDLPKIEDTETQDKQIDSDASNSAITVNEIRALHGRPPFDDGDVIPKVYEQVQLQKVQPPPAPGGAPGGMPGQPGAPATPGQPGASSPSPTPGGEQGEQPDNPFAELAQAEQSGGGDDNGQGGDVAADDAGDGSPGIEDTLSHAALKALGVGASSHHPRHAAHAHHGKSGMFRDHRGHKYRLDNGRRVKIRKAVAEQGDAAEQGNPATGDPSASVLLLAMMQAHINGDKKTAAALEALREHPDQLKAMLADLQGGEGGEDESAGDADAGETIKKATTGSSPVALPSSTWAARYGLVFDTTSRRWKKKGGTPGAAPGQLPKNQVAPADRIGHVEASANSVDLAHKAPHELTLDHVGAMAAHLDSIRVVELKAMARHIGAKLGGKRVELANRLYERVKGEVHGGVEAGRPMAAFSGSVKPGSMKPAAQTAGNSSPSPNAGASPWSMSPDELKQAGVKFFKTGQGSIYAVHPNGQTIRIKSDHASTGHDATDVGLKSSSHKTVYVPSNVASALSTAGVTGPDGKPPKARVVLHDGKATLVSWNHKEGKWGATAHGSNVPTSDKPAVGMSPLELWHPKSDIPGQKAYSGMHAGSAITGEMSVEEGHKALTNAARKAGKTDVYSGKSSSPSPTVHPDPAKNAAILGAAKKEYRRLRDTGADHATANKAANEIVAGARKNGGATPSRPTTQSHPVAGPARLNKPIPTEHLDAPAKVVATVAAQNPEHQSRLAKAAGWVDRYSLRYAKQVADHFNIPPMQAHKMLANVMKQIAEHAVKNGSQWVRGSISHGGKKLNFQAGRTPEQVKERDDKISAEVRARTAASVAKGDEDNKRFRENKEKHMASRLGKNDEQHEDRAAMTRDKGEPNVPRPKNKAGKGSLPGKIGKAFDDDTDEGVWAVDEWTGELVDISPDDFASPIAKSHARITHLDPAPYGYCPECRTAGLSVEDNAGGELVHCGNGHVYEAGRAKYASTQVEVGGEIARELKALGAMIDPADLADDGLEKSHHITAKYGLKDTVPGRVKKVLCGAGC